MWSRQRSPPGVGDILRMLYCSEVDHSHSWNPRRTYGNVGSSRECGDRNLSVRQGDKTRGPGNTVALKLIIFCILYYNAVDHVFEVQEERPLGRTAREPDEQLCGKPGRAQGLSHEKRIIGGVTATAGSGEDGHRLHAEYDDCCHGSRDGEHGHDEWRTKTPRRRQRETISGK